MHGSLRPRHPACSQSGEETLARPQDSKRCHSEGRASFESFGLSHRSHRGPVAQHVPQTNTSTGRGPNSTGEKRCSYLRGCRLAAGTPAGQTAVCTRRTSTRRWRWSTATSRPRWRATRRMRATAERTRIATPAAAGDRRSVRRPPRAPPGPPATDWTCPPSLPTTPRVDNSTARASAPQAVAPRSCSRPPAAHEMSGC